MNPAQQPAVTLTAAVQQAHAHAAVADYAAAAAVLRPLMQHLDPNTTNADVVVAEAAMLYATAPGDDLSYDERLAWLQYGHTTATINEAADHGFAATATWALASHLRGAGLADQALPLLYTVLADLQCDGDQRNALIARAELAAGLHDAGHCGEAVREVDQAWRSWRVNSHQGLDDGLHLLATYTALLLGCNRRADITRLHIDAENRLRHSTAYVEGRMPHIAALVAEHAAVCVARVDLTTLTAAAGQAPRLTTRASP